MFKKFRNALTEVTEEVKANPRFQNLNQLAAQTYSSMSTEGGQSDDLLGPSSGLSSEAFLREDSNSEFFSLGHEDSLLGGGSDDLSSLFPVYEAPPVTSPPQMDLESATEAESSLASEASSVVSKEQLMSMLSRSRRRASKYKSRYGALAQAYTDVKGENTKITHVMQQTQDKALRRISELREQCSLSQKAKQHLEEELRGDMEEKEHIIKTLETKVALLKSGGSITQHTPEEELNGGGPLVVIDMDEKPSPAAQEKMLHLEDKVKRLENLLNKCKESITANKQKISALVEVKESLSKQLSEKTAELASSSGKFEEELGNLKKERDDALEACEELKTKDQNDELQIAESKLMVHQEMITKDEEISRLRHSLQGMTAERDDQTQVIADLRVEMTELTAAQKSLEGLLEEEKSSTLTEVSRSKAEALEALTAQNKEEKSRFFAEFMEEKENLKKKHEDDRIKAVNGVLMEKKRELRNLEDSMKAKLIEKEKENILALEENELRIKSLVKAEEKKNELLRDLETKLKSHSRERAFHDKETEALNKEISNLKVTKRSDEALEKIVDSQKTELEALKSAKVDLLSTIESKDALIRGLEEAQSSPGESLERRYYNESLPDMIQSKEDEVQRLREECKLEVSVLKEELSGVQAQNAELRNAGEFPLAAAELEKQKAEVLKLEAQLGNLLSAKQELEGSFNVFRGEAEKAKEEVRKAAMAEALEAVAKKDELIKAISLESSNEMEKLKKELNEVKTNSETSLENLKSVNASKIAKLEANNADSLARIQEAHRGEMEEMNSKISELRQGKNIELLEENTVLQKSLSSLEEKFRAMSEELSEALRQKMQVQKNLEEKLQEIDRMNESQKLSQGDSEKEIASLRERERSQKDLEAQMITYQKELQSEIKRMEDLDKEKSKLLHELRLESESKSHENKKNAERFDQQVADLKTDLEMKIRLERERENAHTELKRQSIEYQKKLQEQLQEKESFLMAAKEEISCFEGKVVNMNNLHSREIGRLSNRISELTNSVKELEERRDVDTDLTEKTLKECDGLRESLIAKEEEFRAKLTEDKPCESCSSLQRDIDSLREGQESLARERDLSIESKENKIVEMEESLNSQSASLKSLREEVARLEGEREERERQREEEVASLWRQREELLSAQKRDYESSIEELSAKVLKLQEELSAHSWGGWDHEPIDLQNQTSFSNEEDSQVENALLAEHSSIATLKVNNNNNSIHGSSSYACSLEEAAEFEYLKNILYQYMLGKESLTLAKVLATVVKFNQEQVNKIMLHEEQKKSLLPSFALHNNSSFSS